MNYQLTVHTLLSFKIFQLLAIMIAVSALSGCNPLDRFVGTSFTHIRAHEQTQRDNVPVLIELGDLIHNVQLRREKSHGDVTGYFLDVSVRFSSKLNFYRVKLEIDGTDIYLTGDSFLQNVDARTYGVYYNIASTFRITPEQVRAIASADTVILTVISEIDLSIEFGPKALNSFIVFQETFIDNDGVGQTITRSELKKSD